MDVKNRAAKAELVSVEEIKALIGDLPLGLKEQLIADVIALLTPESKQRIFQLGGAIGLSDSSSISLSLYAQIENAPNIDIPAIIEAVVLRHQGERTKKSS